MAPAAVRSTEREAVAVLPAVASASRDPRLLFLDSIRALAALYVVVHHLHLNVYRSYPVNSGPGIFDVLMYGHAAVAVFIVLSGFSLALEPVQRGHRVVGGLGRFIRRRAWRIIPPYWAALALSTVLVAALVEPRMEYGLGLKDVVVHLLLMQDFVDAAAPNTAFWTIAVEWQLYLLFPLLLAVRRRLGARALLVSTLVVVIGLQLPDGDLVDRVLRLTPQFGALFVFGMLAAEVTTRSGGSGWARWWGRLAIAAGLATAAIAAALGTRRFVANIYWLDLLVGAATACALAHLAGTERGRMRRALEAPWLVALGAFSYSIYLIPSPLLLLAWLYVLRPLDLPQLASFALMVFVVGPLVVALSYAFHIAVERPCLKRRSSVRHLPDGASATD
jgi:peptidoglycan/LPS O-acetylase OafA/YrhL